MLSATTNDVSIEASDLFWVCFFAFILKKKNILDYRFFFLLFIFLLFGCVSVDHLEWIRSICNYSIKRVNSIMPCLIVYDLICNTILEKKNSKLSELSLSTPKWVIAKIIAKTFVMPLANCLVWHFDHAFDKMIDFSYGAEQTTSLSPLFGYVFFCVLLIQFWFKL